MGKMNPLTAIGLLIGGATVGAFTIALLNAASRADESQDDVKEWEREQILHQVAHRGIVVRDWEECKEYLRKHPDLCASLLSVASTLRHTFPQYLIELTWEKELRPNSGGEEVESLRFWVWTNDPRHVRWVREQYLGPMLRGLSGVVELTNRFHDFDPPPRCGTCGRELRERWHRELGHVVETCYHCFTHLSGATAALLLRTNRKEVTGGDDRQSEPADETHSG